MTTELTETIALCVGRDIVKFNVVYEQSHGEHYNKFRIVKVLDIHGQDVNKTSVHYKAIKQRLFKTLKKKRTTI